MGRLGNAKTGRTVFVYPALIDITTTIFFIIIVVVIIIIIIVIGMRNNLRKGLFFPLDWLLPRSRITDTRIIEFFFLLSFYRSLVPFPHLLTDSPSSLSSSAIRPLDAPVVLSLKNCWQKCIRQIPGVFETPRSLSCAAYSWNAELGAFDSVLTVRDNACFVDQCLPSFIFPILGGFRGFFFKLLFLSLGPRVFLFFFVLRTDYISNCHFIFLAFFFLILFILLFG